MLALRKRVPGWRLGCSIHLSKDGHKLSTMLVLFFLSIRNGNQLVTSIANGMTCFTVKYTNGQWSGYENDDHKCYANTSSANYKRLCRVFDCCKRADLVDKIKQLLAESNSSSDEEGTTSPAIISTASMLDYCQ